jgi:hypothetical protein
VSRPSGQDIDDAVTRPVVKHDDDALTRPVERVKPTSGDH